MYGKGRKKKPRALALRLYVCHGLLLFFSSFFPAKGRAVPPELCGSIGRGISFVSVHSASCTATIPLLIELLALKILYSSQPCPAVVRAVCTKYLFSSTIFNNHENVSKGG